MKNESTALLSALSSLAFAGVACAAPANATKAAPHAATKAAPHAATKAAPHAATKAAPHAATKAAPHAATKAAPHAGKANRTSRAPKRSASGLGDVIIAYPLPPDFAPLSASVPPISPAEAAQSEALCRSGAAKAAKGDAVGAAGDYAQALALSPASDSALYGLAESAGAVGDTATELGCYRQAIYSYDPHRYGTVPGDGYRTNDVVRMMEFALALNRAGQTGEVVAVYDRAAGLLNYENSREHTQEVEMPRFGVGPGQVPYTPQGLEAMAHLVIGSQTSGFDAAELRRAVALAPDSAAANFYLGKYLYGTDNVQAKMFLEKAVRLGDDHTAAAAQGFLQFIR